MGYEVHVAVNKEVPIQWADRVIVLPFDKKYLSLKNVKAIFQARKLLKAQQYAKICIHTTLASTIIRVAALSINARPRIYCIVHGYLFNLNNRLKKWFYLIPEKITASVSDIVMVMNCEDYEIATRYKLYKDKLCYINGMGINSSRFKSVSVDQKANHKKKLGYKEDDFLFVYAAEFSKRKNQKLLIRAFSKVRFEKAHLLLAGDGKSLKECKALVKELELMYRVHFLGYVHDIPSLYTACDAVVSTSLIEGLPFNILEAMGCGLPVIASNIKGHRELIEHQKNGLLFETENEEELISNIEEMCYLSSEHRLSYGQMGKEMSKKYILDSVFSQIINAYSE